MALTFDYKVRNQQGQLVEGALDGDSIELVVRRLREMGYLPVSVKPRSKTQVRFSADLNIPGLTDRVKLKDLAVATRQLSSMVDSGLSLVRALSVMVNQVENKQLAKVFTEVRTDAEQGLPFSQALAKHPRVFDDLYIAMVQAGETAGTLDTVLGQLSTTMEKRAAINRRVKSAMTYPAVVGTMMVIILTAMIVFIVPVFKKIFASLGGAKLPLPTRIVISISNTIASVWGLLVLAVIVMLIVAFVKWKNGPGKRTWDGFKLKFPVFGPLMHKVAMSRFTSSFAALVGSGVPILQSLDITSDTAGNQVVADVLQEAKEAVRQGRSIAEPFAKHENVIPNLVTQMVEVGEKAGSLEAMLMKVSQFYDEEVEATVNSLASLLEPLMTVMMGVIIGIMVISLYLPMFDYVKHVPTQ
ncbi:MAG: type II secretion system F family protein [Acidimicrobiales bacterium]